MAQAAAPSIYPQHDVCRRLLTSFGGVTAGQVWVDYYLWELVLNEHPHLEGIIEIGTWEGGFSRYLEAQARCRCMSFCTFDVIQPAKPPLYFRKADVFANPDEVINLLDVWAPCILLCDGGNKPREMETFAPHLSADSVLIVHDWLTEVQPEEVPPMLCPVYEDVCDEIGSMSRVFKPKS